VKIKAISNTKQCSPTPDRKFILLEGELPTDSKGNYVVNSFKENEEEKEVEKDQEYSDEDSGEC